MIQINPAHLGEQTPVHLGEQTPPAKLLILLALKSAPSCSYIPSKIGAFSGAPYGVPPRLRRGSPLGVANGQGRRPRRPQAGGFSPEKNLKNWLLGKGEARAGAGGYVVEGWAAGGQHLWSAGGQAQPVHGLSIRFVHGPSRRRASRCPKGIVHISTGTGVQRAQPFGQGRSPPQPAQRVTTLQSKV